MKLINKIISEAMSIGDHGIQDGVLVSHFVNSVKKSSQVIPRTNIKNFLIENVGKLSMVAELPDGTFDMNEVDGDDILLIDVNGEDTEYRSADEVAANVMEIQIYVDSKAGRLGLN